MLLYPITSPDYHRKYANKKQKLQLKKNHSLHPSFLVILANKPCERNACACEVAIRTKRIHRGPGDADSQQHRDLPHKLRVTIDNNSGAIFILAFYKSPPQAFK